MAAGTRPRRRRAGLATHKTTFSWGRHKTLASLLLVLGFAFSGLAGAVAYFLPAISAAVQSTGGKTTGRAGQNKLHPAKLGSGSTNAVSSGNSFTVLLLGSDNDSKFVSSHVLTQTMILVRVNPQSHQVVMLSIPRDLWVQLSTGGYAKIDAAYSLGGAAAAIQTVENDFQVQINYWAWIGLGGLVNLVNQLGGVNVNAQMPVLDDQYPYDLTGSNPYAYERIAVLPGPQRLNGTNALEYVRSRHGDILEDIARAQKQQQLLLDIKSAAKTMSLFDVPRIAAALNGSIKTDMSLTQINQLLPLARAVTGGNVKQIVLYSSYYTGQVISGQDALVPNWPAINSLVSQYFPA